MSVKDTPGSGRQGGVQVISRVTAILRAVANSPSGLSLAELGRIVDLPRSTVYRIVATLADDGFVAMPGGRTAPRTARRCSRRSTRWRWTPHCPRSS